MNHPERDDELVFLPLGGSGEIGMNFNAYGYGPPDDRKWIVVDCGVLFGNEATTPGIELIVPDIKYLAERRENVLAIIATHAHEDHIGAIPYLWPRLRCPIYATPFTARIIEGKLDDAGLFAEAPVTRVPLGGTVSVGSFSVEYISITHSIPEPNGLAVRTPLGTVLHTGDWKLDPDPLLGEPTDSEAFRRLGDEGVLAMVCDSTNTLIGGESGSEAVLRDSLIELIGGLAGRIAVAAFSSNVARLDTVAKAARRYGRRVALVGRSMHKFTAAARSAGYLRDFPDLIDEAEAANLPPHKILYLCTGSQGEARAALTRIAANEHRHVRLGAGDAAIFSARIIPGNDLAIFDVQNRLSAQGVEIFSVESHFVHVSGHPCRDELEKMYAWARPRIAVPVHGERRHMASHASLARSLQVPEVAIPENGQVLRLAPGRVQVVDEVHFERIHIDGRILVNASEGVTRRRRSMGVGGFIGITIVVGKNGRPVADPILMFEGVPDAVHQPVCRAVFDCVRQHAPRRDDREALMEATRRAARRAAEKAWGKKPITRVEIVAI